MFWRRNRPAANAATPIALSPVRIFTTDSTIDGWVDLFGQRLSDVLNAVDSLNVSGVPVPLDESDWFVTNRERMLLVVPPPQASDRPLRRHRVKRRLLALSGHYVVRGVVHMVAGIELDPFLARSGQHSLPITKAWITSTERPEIDEQQAALLINVRNTSQRLQLEVLE